MSEWDPNKVRLQMARDLREIVRLWRLLGEEAAEHSNDREMPGGEAMNYLGPAANVEAWQHRYDAVEAAALATDAAFETKLGGHDYAPDQIAEQHPLLVLATWEDVVREERDQPTDLRATVERAADYLRGSLDWMLGVNDWGDLNFLGIDALAADLRKCRRALEDVTKEGDRAEVSRVWCVAEACVPARPRLIRKVTDEGYVNWWVCPTCKSDYDYDEFIRARAINLHSEGAERFVLVTDAIEAVEAKKQTVWSWVRRLKVVAACDIKTRRVMVWWPSVRDAERERVVADLRRRAG